MLWDEEECFTIHLNDISHQEAILSLKLANQNQEKAISVVSHELRNPINGLLGIVRIMEKSTHDQTLLRSIAIMKTNVYLLLNILNSILDIQQLRSNKLTLTINEVNLHEVINNIKDLYEYQFKTKSLEFYTRIDPTIPKCIKTDKNRLNQILINLVANSLKFTSKGSVTVSVSRDPSDKNKVLFKVIDTGIGIKAGDCDKLFKMFGKLQSTMDMNQEGVGLGLMISNSLVKILNRNEENNQIKIESDGKIGATLYFSIYADYDKGKEFSIEDNLIHEIHEETLDTTRIDELMGTAKAEDLQAGLKFIFSKSSTRDLRKKQRKICNDEKNGMPYLGSPLRISPNSIITGKTFFNSYFALLVDDDIFNLTASKDLLESNGFICELASNGYSAIEKLENSKKNGPKFDLVLMDYDMPGLNGLETASQIKKKISKKELEDVPIIGLSGYDSPQIEKNCMDVGMACCLVKPLTSKEISKLLTFIKKKW